MNTYEDLEQEYNQLITQWKDTPSIFSLGHVDDVFALTSELLRQQKVKMKQEQEILMKTRGVFKYVTFCYFKDKTSTKNSLVQVGYLDLDDNIVFNEPDIEFVGKPDTLVRYLPGFMVRGYRSCQEYIPITNSHNGKDTKEINEVISNSSTIQYCPSSYGNSPKVTYSVIGYLNDDEELVYYNQLANKE